MGCRIFQSIAFTVTQRVSRNGRSQLRDQVGNGSSCHLAFDSPPGERGRSGRCHREIPRLAGTEFGGQADGLLQLLEPLDRGSCGAFPDSEISRVPGAVAGPFRRRLPAGAVRSSARRDRTWFTNFGRRFPSCVAVRNERNCGAAQVLRRRGPHHKLPATSKLDLARRKLRCGP